MGVLAILDHKYIHTYIYIMHVCIYIYIYIYMYIYTYTALQHARVRMSSRGRAGRATRATRAGQNDPREILQACQARPQVL